MLIHGVSFRNQVVFPCEIMLFEVQMPFSLLIYFCVLVKMRYNRITHFVTGTKPASIKSGFRK